MMRLPKFRYLQPRTAADAVQAAADAGPEGMYVAGGTDLYPNMKRRHQTPRVVVGLRRVRELRAKSGSPTAGLTLGPNLTLTEVSRDPDVRKAYPALARACLLISTPILQNMGTIGGNLLLDTRCNYYNQNQEWRKAIHFCMKKDGDTCWVAPGSPRCWAVNSSDGAPVAIALGARLAFLGPDGERTVSAEDLYRDDGIAYAAKKPEELLLRIELPPVDGWRATYQKLRRRGSFDFPVLGVAAAVRRDGDRVAEARVVLGAVASRPYRSREAEAALVGRTLDDTSIAAAAEAAFKPAKPMDNTDFGLAWRKEMVRQYVIRALRELRDGA
ncbi:MAG: FAD binding domain-containing protein [Planctomycetales bacterium]|nr:FAD binding domain-containing protein [Planctomycetales bacterium]